MRGDNDIEANLRGFTRDFALQVIQLTRQFRSGRTEDILVRQLIRSATSVGANYRAACRARSKAEFIAKLGIVEEEADESIYWLEIMVNAGICERDDVVSLIQRANDIVAMTVSSIRTARQNIKSEKKGRSR